MLLQITILVVSTTLVLSLAYRYGYLAGVNRITVKMLESQMQNGSAEWTKDVKNNNSK